MERAREIAKDGSCAGFGHMVQLISDDGLTLRLWADATQRDQIDRWCAQACSAASHVKGNESNVAPKHTQRTNDRPQ